MSRRVASGFVAMAVLIQVAPGHPCNTAAMAANPGQVAAAFRVARLPLAANSFICFDTLRSQADPSWGRVAAPSAGIAYYQLDYASGTVSRQTDNGYTFNDGQNGVYTFTGPANRAISYSVTFSSFSGTGVSVVSIVVNGYVDAPGSGVTNALGDFVLKVGGTLAVAPNAAAEPHNATITVVVNYQ